MGASNPVSSEQDAQTSETVKPMKVLIVHNYYQNPGGEDVVFAAETKLLQDHGHEVEQFIATNDDVETMSRLKLGINMIWSREYNDKLRQAIKDFQPDIVHFHNTFMLISPSAYYVCQQMGVPVVQTLHNFRLLCPSATFYRDDQVCTECLGKRFALPGIQHQCYRESRAQSAGVATMLAFHHARNTWQKKVDTYISLTEFGKDKFVEAGFPPEKMAVKPNFLVNDPGVSTQDDRYMLFMGRMTSEKGLRILIRAWEHLPDVPLKVLGKGPLEDEIKAFAQEHNLTQVEFLGHRPREEALALLKGATALLFPSQWFETFGLVVIEAYATGKPVIASGFGTMLQTVEDGKTGLHFSPQDPLDLAEKVKTLWSDPALTQTLGQQARQTYEQKYTPEANYQRLLEIYNETRARFQASSS